MSFKSLDDLDDLSGRRVLTRVDLNVPMDGGRVTDATRIERVLPTIRELAGKGARVVLLAHFGRPKGQAVADMSLAPVAKALSEHLGRPVAFASDCIGDAARSVVDALAKDQTSCALGLATTVNSEAHEVVHPVSWYDRGN